MRFIVETYTICDGWINCWPENAGEDNPEGTPVTYETKEAAEFAIDEVIDAYKDALKSGYVEDIPERSEFRVVEVENESS